MDPIQCAINGNVQYFKTVSKKVLLRARDHNGYTALDQAIMHYREDCCGEICRKCPELVWEQQNIYIHSALHHAASRGNVNMATSVIDAASKVPGKDDTILLAGGKKFPRRILRLQDIGHHTPLWYAVYNNCYDATKYLLELDHEFVLGSHVESVAAIAKATEAANTGDLTAAKIRDLLIEIKERNSHPKPTVNMKEQNWTELHKAASRGDVDAVRERIQSNPKQIDVVDDEEVPEGLKKVIDNANLVTPRMNAFLEQNKGNSGHQASSSVDRGRQIASGVRGRPRGSSLARGRQFGP
ncbi:hypothetical protein ACHQM5_005820 [Ranunculus cassubicifolius]